MKPIEMIHDICRYYLNDLEDVNLNLLNLVRGYHRSRSVDKLASCSCHFDQALHSVNDWRFLRQVEAFYKKCSNLSNPDVCFKAAHKAFIEAEELCSETNKRLRPYVRYPSSIPDAYRSQVYKMARYIDNVLGPFQPFLEQLPALVKVTSGATSHSNRRNSLPQLKLRMRLYSTSSATQYLKALYHHFGFRDPRFRLTMSNRVELVPKNWKTDRTIACEPEGNLPLQLAFDTFAKRRLRRFGIDLTNQSANQKLAQRASKEDSFVTVDFKAASDTISFNAVQLVFPVDWVNYLCRVRTPFYRGVFGEGVYSKFSSMGNGSTFCIETLLFAAACSAVGARKFLVYGDDVIIEKEFYEPFLLLTRFLGFTVNIDKTFSSGPFRESCGGDYFNGVNVTPTFIRRIDSRKANLCHLVNSMGSIASIGGQLSRYLIGLIKDYKLPLVPYNESSLSGIWIEPKRAITQGILRYKGYIATYRAYVPKSKQRKFVDSRGYYLWFLRKRSQAFFSGPWEIARQSTTLSKPSTQTSSVAVFEHVYVRKRVCWHEPAEGEPDHLYWWSELILARLLAP